MDPFGLLFSRKSHMVTEGLDTVDLKKAKALLSELS